ncbi:hypothetical protein VKT23_008488 [Stygiomarasmius scandens]|uniref:F-box domain-containing protein n=1 Tax=Marasmiellus scandens TaxID=2682957 RepID=A0ABR1JJ46_9AGAR
MAGMRSHSPCSETNGLLNDGDEVRDRLSDSEMEWQFGMVAPILKLPPELLVEILSLVVDSDPGLSLTARNGMSAPTLSLSHICSFWRETVISTPSLWARITVDLGYLNHQRRGLVDIVRLYIQRSSNAWLILGIQALRHGTNSDREEYIEEIPRLGWDVFQLMLDEHARWYRVSIKLRWTLFNQASEEVVGLTPAMNKQCNFPHLENLEIGWESSYWPRRSTNRLFDFFKNNTPVLHTLIIPYYDSSYPFPFHQLTCVHLFDDDAWISAPAMLKSCSAIDKLVLTCGPERIWTTANIVITSTSLKSLRLLMKDFVPAYETLSTLTLPSLVSLHLMTPDPGLSAFALARSTSSDWKRKFWFRNCAEMIQRSGCQLEALVVDGNIFLDKQLLELFTLTPNLRNLSIKTLSWYEPLLTDTFFQQLALHSTHEEENLLPKLTSIEMYVSDIDSIQPSKLASPNGILSMVESRKGSCYPFSELEVFGLSADFDTDRGREWANRFRSEIEPRLLHFQDSGMLRVNLRINV